MINAGANIFGALLILAFVAFAWQLTGEFRRGSGFFPYIVLTLLGATSLLWLLRSLIELRLSRKSVAGAFPGGGGNAGEDGDQPSSADASLGSVGGYAVLGVTLLYGAAVVNIGYVYPSIVYLLLVSLMLGGRQYLTIAAISVGFPLAVYYFLAVGFNRPLPF